jgi:nicotinate-nucleotide pyrophosphorylase (carboxylating)
MAHKTPRNMESSPEVKELIRKALAEDIGSGDVTSRALIGPKETARAVIVSRGRYVLAGGQIAKRVFAACDPSLSVRLLVKDGSRVSAGDPILHVKGKARSILAAERVALNFLQRMTGIATLTRQFVQLAKPHGVQVLDTRKTTPLLRVLEKYAVLCGGGANHRMGLYDRVLIKDNHRAFWKRSRRGGLTEAVVVARRRNPSLQVEIEVESENDLKAVLKASPTWILLDNMPIDRIRRCVQICGGKSKIEVSGGVSLKTVERIAQTGVDAVSIGALTHSAPAADLSLEFCD